MNDGRYDILIAQIETQIPELYLAELIQVADLVRRLKSSRDLDAATGFDNK